MAWEKNIVDAVYTSPSGKEATFKFEELSRSTELKTGVFTFPDRDGARVQHQGAGAKTHPMTCIFSGADCMSQADNFEAMLIERGIAEFQHPIYGILKVVPTGNIARKDDLISELNQSIVTITFTETITDDNIPELDIVTADNIETMMENFTEAAAADFVEGIIAETVPEQLRLKSTLTEQINIIDDSLNGIRKPPKFLATILELENNVKSLFALPESIIKLGLSIGRQVLNILKMPSRIITSITDKIKGYTNLITNMVNQFRNDPFGINNINNAFTSTRLVLNGAVASLASGTALSVAQAVTMSKSASTDSESADEIRGGVMSREAAMEAAVQIESLLETIKEFEDTKIEQNTFIDHNATTFFQLQQIVYSSIKLITECAFSLPMRRTIILDRDRQIIELCCEVYGSEHFLDRFIQENNFNLDEIELLPMGKEVSYYVQSA